MSDVKNLIVYKRLPIRTCLRMPEPWQETAWYSYTHLRKKAEKEQPPGHCTLFICILQALASNDRSFIDRGVSAVMENLPEDAILNISGMGLCELGFHDEGIERLRKAVDLNGSVLNITSLVSHLDNPNEYYEKLLLTKRVLDKEPSNVEALRRAAYVLVQYGQLDEAEEYLRRAIEISPENRYLQEALGEIYFRRGDYEAAIREYQRSRKFLDTSTRVWQQITLCHYFLGNFRKARRSVRRMKRSERQKLKTKKDNTYTDCLVDELDGRIKMGVKYWWNDDKSKAYPFLRIEAIREKKPAEATLHLVALETMQTKNVGVIEKAKKEIGENVPTDLFFTVSGLAKFETGFSEAGLVEMKQAVKLNPSIDNMFNLAACLSTCDDRKQEAKELLDGILSQEPEHIEAICCLGLISDDEDALALYEKALSINSEDWEIHFDMGKLLFSLSRFDEADQAIENVERALVEDPKSEDAKILYQQITEKRHVT
ncbi:MAG: tetratricopeptide repeat protein [Planctomycetota bacterium]|jgi:tetratricopeptide (TPR) repeat protein